MFYLSSGNYEWIVLIIRQGDHWSVTRKKNQKQTKTNQNPKNLGLSQKVTWKELKGSADNISKKLKNSNKEQLMVLFLLSSSASSSCGSALSNSRALLPARCLTPKAAQKQTGTFPAWICPAASRCFQSSCVSDASRNSWKNCSPGSDLQEKERPLRSQDAPALTFKPLPGWNPAVAGL